MNKEIEQTWHFNQPPQKVWEYLTKPELVEQWLGKADIQPSAGHKFSLTGKAGSLIYCEVLEVKPFIHLSYSWQTSSIKSGKAFNSKVVWTLTPKENGTELRLVHNGFVVLEDYELHNNGWTILGSRFIELLNPITK